jgi:chromosome segregation ATPase
MGPYDSAHQVAELTRQVRAIGADLDAERRSRYDSDRDAARLREKLERVTADLARVEAERDEARAEIGRLTAERDARPAITREDAAIYRHATGEGSSALWRVERALAAHAKGGE